MTDCRMDLSIIEKYNMLPPGTRVLCAVSGGADSVCLLHLLTSMREERDITVLAAHFEHGLRGEESREDAAFTQHLCSELGVFCAVGQGDVKGYAEENRLGTEEAARELRYAFLEQAADELGCSRIATAHTLNDNAETMLMNLCRGSGSAGLAGIPPVRGRIVRPLLLVTREEVEAYLIENSLDHREDSTNRDDAFTRNRIRHQLLPMMESFNPAFVKTAGKTAELLREDENCLSQMAEQFLKTHPLSAGIPVEDMLALPKAVAGRVIRDLTGDLSYEQTESVFSFLQGRGFGECAVQNTVIRRDRGRLWRIEECAEKPAEPDFSLEKQANWNGKEINDLLKTYIFKTDAICGKITFTGRAPGDRLRPTGRGCSKSLKSLFLEQNWTQEQRDRALVLRDEKGIVAVSGMAMDERVAPVKGDDVLILRIIDRSEEI